MIVGVVLKRVQLPLDRLWRENRLGMIGSGILVVLVVAAILAPVLAPIPPDYADLLLRDLPPSSAHLLGTDHLGRDVWSRLLNGARLSLTIAAGAIITAGGIGVLVGAVAGYSRGLLGGLLMRLTDIMLALPTFFLLIAIQAILRPGVFNIIFVIAVTGWMFPARLVYGQFLSLRERDYVLAARSLGASDTRIVLKHLLPQTLGPMLIFVTLGAADAILIEAALSFLGLGVPPYQASWGTMLNDAQSNILNGIWWPALFPGLAIFLAALSTNLLGDGLRDWLSHGE